MLSYKQYLLEEEFNNSFVYHGTDLESALNIEAEGINMMKSEKGYFGRGFYTTPNKELTKSNYADFSGDEKGGIVLKFFVKPKVKILDLRDSDDYEKYKKLNLGKELYRDDLYKIMVNKGVDGIYDNSFESIVFYNPNSLKLIDRV